jgi:hypothetical protein
MAFVVAIYLVTVMMLVMIAFCIEVAMVTVSRAVILRPLVVGILGTAMHVNVWNVIAGLLCRSAEPDGAADLAYISRASEQRRERNVPSQRESLLPVLITFVIALHNRARAQPSGRKSVATEVVRIT